MSDGTNDRCVISAKYDACLSFPLALFLAEIWVNNLGLWAAFFPQGCRFRRGFRSVMPPPNSAPLILGAALFVFLQPLAHSSHLFRNCPFQMCIYRVSHSPLQFWHPTYLWHGLTDQAHILGYDSTRSQVLFCVYNSGIDVQMSREKVG